MFYFVLFFEYIYMVLNRRLFYCNNINQLNFFLFFSINFSFLFRIECFPGRSLLLVCCHLFFIYINTLFTTITITYSS